MSDPDVVTGQEFRTALGNASQRDEDTYYTQWDKLRKAYPNADDAELERRMIANDPAKNTTGSKVGNNELPSIRTPSPSDKIDALNESIIHMLRAVTARPTDDASIAASYAAIKAQRDKDAKNNMAAKLNQIFTSVLTQKNGGDPSQSPPQSDGK